MNKLVIKYQWIKNLDLDIEIMRIEELPYVSIIFQKPSKSEDYRTLFAIGYFKFY